MIKTSSIHRIIAGLKRYLGLQREYVMLSFAEKLTVLLTALVVGGIIMMILLLSVVFFSLALSRWISDLTGSEALGYLVVAVLYLLGCVMVYANRRRWIANPIAGFLAEVLLGNGHDGLGEDKKKV